MKTYCFCFLSLVEFEEVANRAWFDPSLTDGANNGMYQSKKKFCACQTLLIRPSQIQTKWHRELLLLALETEYPNELVNLVVSVGLSSRDCLQGNKLLAVSPTALR